MSRLLGLELTGGKLALRVVLAVILGGLAFLVFYYIPTALPGFIQQFLGSNGVSSGASLANSLISPNLPMIGLAVAALIFLGVLLRGTKVYGPILIVLGVVLLAYVYTAFRGGTITLTIPTGFQYSASGAVAIDLTTLMYLFMVAPLLTVLKGAVLTVTKADATSPALQV